MSEAPILVIEDDLEMQALVARALSGLELHFAADLAEARKQLAALPDLGLVLVDLNQAERVASAAAHGDSGRVCGKLQAVGRRGRATAP